MVFFRGFLYLVGLVCLLFLAGCEPNDEHVAVQVNDMAALQQYYHQRLDQLMEKHGVQGLS